MAISSTEIIVLHLKIGELFLTTSVFVVIRITIVAVTEVTEACVNLY